MKRNKRSNQWSRCLRIWCSREVLMANTVDVVFIGTVTKLYSNSRSWNVICFVKELNWELQFLVDSGTDCIWLPATYRYWPKVYSQNLARYPKIKAPDGNVLDLTLEYDELNRVFTYYVVNVLKLHCLLLMVFAHSKYCLFQDLMLPCDLNYKFPRIFQELGEFRGEVV